MNLASIIVAFVVCCSAVSATSPFITVEDVENQMVAFDEARFFIDIDEDWHSVGSLYADEEGVCYLPTGGRNHSQSDSDAELSCILQCPGCSRLQTCTAVSKNRGHCSRCTYIFPASDFSWKCTNCGTQNYLNPEQCGLPSCRCPRHLCDPDVKTNIKTT